MTVRHWNETGFSFTTPRDPGFRFENGHFVMLGLQINGKQLMRAYSIASANHEEFLEFLAYRDYIEWELTHHEYLGDRVREQLIYYPTVTRARFRYQGRVTSLIETGTLFEHIAMPDFDPATDRVMICGSSAMLADLSALLDARGFHISPQVGQPGDYVIERSFVAR